MDQSYKYKVILPITMLVSSLILGGFYYAAEISKQESMEKQQMLRLEDERTREDSRMAKEREDAEAEKKTRKDCHDEAVEKATNVIKARSDIDSTYANQYKGAVEKGLYTKEDYDKFYEDCLSRNGLKK